MLYKNNEKTKREIKETILFTIAKKIIAHLEINLHKEKKGLYVYIENYKAMMIGTRDETDGELHQIGGLEETI